MTILRRIAAVATAAGLVLTLAACAGENDDLADLYKQGGNQGFISGDGRVEQIPVDERGEPVEFTGTAVDGSTVTSADYADQVLVLNFWYAECGPCRAEAPLLEEAYEAAVPAGADFLGVNIYDGPEQAAAFEETYGITYPSVLASGDVDLKLAFTSWTSLQAAPTTLVLDAEGRVAARFFGQLESSSILRSIVKDTVAEAS
ncbi:TlpA family protein disulfide reductase [Microbacterium invictum]|uniref:Thiol-disulfide isomerase/thioredoxin n=1 Tax=Microbacterium invictum TaxID=515415 RepID=A0AA40VLI2_9MICO|nr:MULTISPECIES: TlpA disulfide reductase family protein [Microbacterium]MBB4138273.1 thiol-disulfide isomerase/thioredoxin [Microbacterium invictum]